MFAPISRTQSPTDINDNNSVLQTGNREQPSKYTSKVTSGGYSTETPGAISIMNGGTRCNNDRLVRRNESTRQRPGNVWRLRVIQARTMQNAVMIRSINPPSHTFCNQIEAIISCFARFTSANTSR